MPLRSCIKKRVASRETISMRLRGAAQNSNGSVNPHGGKRPRGAKVLPPQPKKKRRFKPDTRAVAEIRKELKSTALSFRKLPFARLVKEVLQDAAPQDANKGKGVVQNNFRVTAQSLSVLQTAAEAFLVNVFQVRRTL